MWLADLELPGGFRRQVALKVLFSGDGLRREARIGGLLRHPNLVDVYEVGEQDGTWFAAMELCRDGSLADHVPLPPRAVVDVGLQVCAALQYAHEALGLVHRDLKPANLLLDGPTVKVADLGLARARGFESERRIEGTPGYMAPEQLCGEVVDARADVYALGVVLHQLATGALPDAATFSLDDPLPIEAPAWLSPIVDACLQEDPADRPPSMAALAERLEALDASGASLSELVAERPDDPASAWIGTISVGRAAEQAALRALLEEPGLVTVRGPGGMGKTHLVQTVTGDRAIFCDLSSARGEAELLQTVAAALSIELGRGARAAWVDALGLALAARGQVLVLDNFEQLVDHAGVVDRWRQLAPTARLVLTSRVALGLQAERVLSLGPLEQDDALALLQAHAMRRGVVLGDDPTTRQLAARLDAVPLALVLAAGRLGVLSADEILDRLEPAVLRSGTTGRHATLDATLQWSWDLLTPAERRALAQLSVFRGGFTLSAAEAVLRLEDDAGWSLAVVASLVERSMVSEQHGRLRLLELVRTWAADHLVDADATRDRHAAWACTLPPAEHAVELPNLVAACEHTIASRDPARALPLALACVEVLSVSGSLETYESLLEAVLDLDGIEPRDRAHLQSRLARALEASDQARAEAHASAAEERFLALGDEVGAAHARKVLALVAHNRGQSSRARELAASAMAVFEAAELHAEVCSAARVLATTHVFAGTPDVALPILERALALAEREGLEREATGLISTMGMALFKLDRDDEAERWLDDAQARHRAQGRMRRRTASLGALGALAVRRGDQVRARAVFLDALDSCASAGDLRGTIAYRGALAVTERQLGQLVGAVEHYVEAIRLSRLIGLTRHLSVNLRNLSKLLSLADLPASAARLAVEARACLAGSDDASQLVQAELCLCTTAMATESWDDALTHARSARVLAEGVASPDPVFQARIYESIVLSCLGKIDDARQEAEVALAIAVAEAWTSREAWARTALAVERATAGDAVAAWEQLTRALELTEGADSLERQIVLENAVRVACTTADAREEELRELLARLRPSDEVRAAILERL